jgi:hypothetical protein
MSEKESATYQSIWDGGKAVDIYSIKYSGKDGG